MANANPVSVGRANAGGSEDALFLKVFAGEVLTSFERASKTMETLLFNGFGFF